MCVFKIDGRIHIKFLIVALPFPLGVGGRNSNGAVDKRDFGEIHMHLLGVETHFPHISVSEI